MNNDHAEPTETALSPTLRADPIARADQVFAWFTDWTQEVLRNAREHLRTAPTDLALAAH